MTKAEQLRYANAPAIAVYGLTNHGGIEIVDFIEDAVIYRYNFGTPQEVHRAKLYLGVKECSFRTIAGYSIRLDDCQNVG